ncbi:histone H1-like [Poecilia latipinna]|uniref:histone H1-like n=1 Tax=Poecilia latipinna TaxID=48699 RepID=UPI00072E0D96|nr:PREDICTED: histone H1-like [Poecilia latipinna]
MTEVAPAAVRSSAKLSMKKSASRTRKDGPSISKLIVDAVADSKERKGVSLAALKKLLARNGVDVTKSNKRINSAITKLVTGGSLSRTRGTGASGSFKIAKPKARKKKPKPAKPVKKATPKKKKKAPAKAKRPAAKKSPKKSPAKKPARKSPKKGPAKKAAKRVKRSPRKTTKKSPKKSPKKATARRPKPAKRPAAKRSPAKKRPAKKAKRSYW